MKATRGLQVLVLVVHFFPGLSAYPKEAKREAPVAWAYARNGAEVRRSPSKGKPAIARLGRGALVPVFKTDSKGWTSVRIVEPARLNAQMGWTGADEVEVLPPDQFPTDAELLKQMGGAFLEDYTASHTTLARYLVRRGGRGPALVCFLGSPILPSARLQVFLPSRGRFAPGPFLEFASSEMDTGITALEVRDLVGDGNECLVTREPFRLAPEDFGINLVIRRIEGSEVRKLWEAPLEFRNLSSYPARSEVLAPPERNIGAAGTVTTGEVEFRLRDGRTEPIWRGKVEFRAFNRSEPLETIPIEKVCPWDGTKFMPLR